MIKKYKFETIEKLLLSLNKEDLELGLLLIKKIRTPPPDKIIEILFCKTPYWMVVDYFFNGKRQEFEEKVYGYTDFKKYILEKYEK